MHRPRQPGASLARRPPPHIVAKEPIPAAFEPRAPKPYRMDLGAILPREAIAAMRDRGRMTFHCVGDTGGVKRPESQHLVARGMEMSAAQPSTTPVSFCYHLGDVVYYTGEVPDYWDQFYEPYEHYPLDILAIPGNHDGELLTKQSISLAGFHDNFLAAAPGTHTRESGDSGRPAMHLPYFYWTLTTPLATDVQLSGRADDARQGRAGRPRAADRRARRPHHGHDNPPSAGHGTRHSSRKHAA